MSKHAAGSLWVECVILGTALGFLISSFTRYSVGMLIGTMVGLGAACSTNALAGH